MSHTSRLIRELQETFFILAGNMVPNTESLFSIDSVIPVGSGNEECTPFSHPTIPSAANAYSSREKRKICETLESFFRKRNSL